MWSIQAYVLSSHCLGLLPIQLTDNVQAAASRETEALDSGAGFHKLSDVLWKWTILSVCFKLIEVRQGRKASRTVDIRAMTAASAVCLSDELLQCWIEESFQIPIGQLKSIILTYLLFYSASFLAGFERDERDEAHRPCGLGSDPVASHTP